MLHLLIFVGWLVALGCMLCLVYEAIRNRFSKTLHGKPESQAVGRLRWGFRSNRKRESQKNIDTVIQPKPSEPIPNLSRGIKRLGYVLLILWEAYWISEIVERFYQTTKPWQLPFFFLLGVMIGVPLIVYLVARRAVRVSAT